MCSLTLTGSSRRGSCTGSIPPSSATSRPAPAGLRSSASCSLPEWACRACCGPRRPRARNWRPTCSTGSAACSAYPSGSRAAAQAAACSRIPRRAACSWPWSPPVSGQRRSSPTTRASRRTSGRSWPTRVSMPIRAWRRRPGLSASAETGCERFPSMPPGGWTSTRSPPRWMPTPPQDGDLSSSPRRWARRPRAPSTPWRRSRRSPRGMPRGCMSMPRGRVRRRSAPSFANRSWRVPNQPTAGASTHTSGCSSTSTATRSGWPTGRPWSRPSP